MKPRIYVAVLLLVAAISPIATASFNLAVDPYDFRGMLGISPIDPNRRSLYGAPGPMSTEWMGTLVNVRWFKPDAVVLGSSAVGGMLNYHELWSKPDRRFGRRPFHYDVGGVSIGQLKHFFLHTQALNALDSAIVELQFYMFDADRQRLTSQFFDVPLAHEPNYDRRFVRRAIDMAFTEANTKDSLNWLALSRFGVSTWQQAVGRWWRNIVPEPLPVSIAATQVVITPREYQDRILAVDRAIYSGLFQNTSKYRFVDDANGDTTNHLREIIAEARRRKTRLRLFLSPSHARMYEIIRLNGQWSLFEEWKRRVTAIVAEDAATHPDDPIILWDFANYNSITTEPFPQEAGAAIGYQAYIDTVHFNRFVSNRVLDRLFGTHTPDLSMPDDFGVALTPRNIDDALRANRMRQVAYGQEHAGEIAELRVMLDSARQ